MWREKTGNEQNFRGYVFEFKFEDKKGIIENCKDFKDFLTKQNLHNTKEDREELRNYIDSLGISESLKKTLLTSVLDILGVDKEEIKVQLKDILVKYSGYDAWHHIHYLTKLIQPKVASEEFTLSDFDEIRENVRTTIQDEYLDRSLEHSLNYAFLDKEHELASLEDEISTKEKLLESPEEIIPLKEKLKNLLEENNEEIDYLKEKLKNLLEENNSEIDSLKEELKDQEEANKEIYATHQKISYLEKENSILKSIESNTPENLKEDIKSKIADKENLEKFINHCKDEKQVIINYSKENPKIYAQGLIDWYKARESDKDMKNIFNKQLSIVLTLEKHLINSKLDELDRFMGICGMHVQKQKPNIAGEQKTSNKESNFLSSLYKLFQGIYKKTIESIIDLNSRYEQAKTPYNQLKFLTKVMDLFSKPFATSNKNKGKGQKGTNPYEVLDTTYGMHGEQDDVPTNTQINATQKTTINKNDTVYKTDLDQLLLSSDFKKEDLDGLLDQNKDLKDYFNDRYQAPINIKKEVQDVLNELDKQVGAKPNSQ